MPVHLVEHPVVQDALLTLRDARTRAEEFRRVSNRLALMLVAEATRDLPRRVDTVQTPLGWFAPGGEAAMPLIRTLKFDETASSLSSIVPQKTSTFAPKRQSVAAVGSGPK